MIQSRTIAKVSKHNDLISMGLLTALNSIALSAWLWLKSNQSQLPDPQSAEGEDLLRRYLMISHEIFLIAIIGTSSFLIVKALHYRRQEANRHPKIINTRISGFLLRHPLYALIFIGYTAAILHESSFLYKDMIGWTGNFFSDQLTDSLTIKSRILGETMRRSDYRFFPLAHQDLHALSWLSHQVKTWLLASAAQLAIITIALKKLVQNLCARAHKQLTDPLLLITLLLLFHPSPSESFFQVIYSERMLALFFSLFAWAYASHQKTGHRSSLYFTLLFALLGSFTKDIAILLFCTPAAAILIYRAAQRHRQATPGNSTQHLTAASRDKQLEKYLLLLTPIFSFCYISLSLIPSTLADQAAYADNYIFTFSPDLRFSLFALYSSGRLILISTKKLIPSLIDALNLGAISYTIALSSLIGFKADSYLALPVQIIVIINIAYPWCKASSAIKTKKNSHLLQLSGIGSALAILTTEALIQQPTFASKVAGIKYEQITNTKTFNKIPDVIKKSRRQGSEINLIYDASSRFSHKRHLNRLNFDRLIEHDKGRFTIKEGTDKDRTHQPQNGDILISINDDPSWVQAVLDKTKSTQLFHIKRQSFQGQIIRIDAVQRQ